MQRDRNGKLQKAEEEIKKQCTHGETVKIDWKERSVTCQDVAAYTQDIDESSENFLSAFTQLVVQKTWAEHDLSQSFLREYDVASPFEG